MRDVVDSDGDVRVHRQFDSFGNIIGETHYDTAGDPVTNTDPEYIDEAFAYTGRWFDAKTDLQNNLNRWYDADTGRWMSEDPIGFAAGDANLYRYVGNEPTNAIDPYGLTFLSDYWCYLTRKCTTDDILQDISDGGVVVAGIGVGGVVGVGAAGVAAAAGAGTITTGIISGGVSGAVSGAIAGLPEGEPGKGAIVGGTIGAVTGGILPKLCPPKKGPTPAELEAFDQFFNNKGPTVVIQGDPPPPPINRLPTIGGPPENVGPLPPPWNPWYPWNLPGVRPSYDLPPGLN